MQIKAEQKFVRVSPRKVRAVADSVRQLKKPEQVLAYLEHMNKAAAAPLSKTIKQALANAKNNLGLSENGLLIKTIQVNEGPTRKTRRIVSRGRSHLIQKKTSHIRVVLEATKPKVVKSEEKTSKKQKTEGKIKPEKGGES